MSKHYKGTIGTDILVNVGCDVENASDLELWVTKPSGTKVIWIPVVKNKRFLQYTIADGDWNESGTYNLQAYVEINGWKGPGDETTFEIYDTIKD